LEYRHRHAVRSGLRRQLSQLTVDRCSTQAPHQRQNFDVRHVSSLRIVRVHPCTAQPDYGPLYSGCVKVQIMSVEQVGGLPVSAPQERGDAARNRVLLLDAARRLIAERGADAVSMDDIVAAAGVGKGTVFRRFGSRAGLMMVLLGEDESRLQQAFMFGPPPLGPDAPPLERLLAFGGERLRFVHTHHTLLSATSRDPQTRYNAPARVLHTHVRMLLASAG